MPKAEFEAETPPNLHTNVLTYSQIEKATADSPECAQQVCVQIEGRLHKVDIEYINARKTPERKPLTREWARRHRPEKFRSIREMVNSHHKRNKPGLTYFHSTGGLVSHESRLESFALLQLDWEGDTVGISAQPFTLHFQRSKKPVAHTPDYFTRLSDGSGLIIDVKSRAHLANEDVTIQHLLTEDLSQQAGLRYRVITDPTNPYFKSNLNLLAGYRATPLGYDAVYPQLVTALQDKPVLFGVLKSQVADAMGTPDAFVAPHILHSLWTHALIADLNHELTTTTPIALSAGATR